MKKTINFNKKQRRETHLNAYHKLFLCLLMINLIAIPLISAWTFDDVRNYDYNNRELTITNAFGLGSDLIKAKLTSDQEVHVLPGWKKVATIEASVYDKEKLIEGLKFYDYNDNGMRINSDYEIKYSKQGDVLVIELWATVNEGDKIEWIPTIYGYEVKEWATFIGSERYERFYQNNSKTTIYVSSWLGQVFRIGSTGDNETFELTGLSLWLNKTGNPTKVGFYVTGVNASNAPDFSSILSTNETVDIAQLSGAAPTGYNISMPTTTLYKGSNYAFVVNVSMPTDTNAILAAQNTSHSKYVGDSYVSSNKGVTWTASGGGNYTVRFEVWGIRLGISTNLNVPSNNTSFLKNNFNFTSNYTLGTGYVPTNASYYFWWKNNGTRFNQINITIKPSRNATEVNLTAIPFGSFNWNVYACSNDTTSTSCGFDTSNRTFERAIFNNTGKNHSILTTEGNSEMFKLNITMATGEILSTATLVYNNTEYSGYFTNSNSHYFITRTIIVPTTASNVNKTFYWEIRSNTGRVKNTTNYRQQVNSISIDDCSVNTVVILNYTLKDEGNQTEIDEDTQNSSIEIDISIFPKGNPTIEIINFSANYLEDNPVGVCLSALENGTEYRMDVATKYSTTTREVEYHHLQNYSLTNSTINHNITLYDLLSVDSTSFEITYKDESFLPVSNALIDIQRQYVGDGVFKTVEIPKTDQDGKTVAHLVKDDIVYTFIVKKDGVILATFENVKAFCDDAVIGDCRISLNEVEKDSDLGDWQNYRNLDYTLDFDEDTRTITLIFSTIDGSTSTVTLNTTRSDRWGNATVCSDTLTSSSGTLTCVIPDSYGNVTVITKVYVANSPGIPIITRIYKIFPDLEDYFGKGNAVIMLLIMVMSIALMFVSSTIGVIIGAALGLIMAGGLMIYTGFSLLGSTSAILWLIIAGGILIWKISERAKL